MTSGEMTVCDFKLTKDDIVVKREFSGDAKVRLLIFVSVCLFVCLSVYIYIDIDIYMCVYVRVCIYICENVSV